ncbi:hypothetical protein [Allosphingosinicella sp.]|uniref:hypothetical protein n=1 Tax=Allosphingosinicella sp. TaxID=2823234 RepID=UPI0037842D56
MSLALQDILSISTATGTVLAAGFAAWSAYSSRSAAKAAEAGVDEARKTRKAQQAPSLILERDFLDFHLAWPHPDSLNGEPVFLARRDWQDKNPIPPTFSLTNYGASPALELTVDFFLEDPNGEFSVPAAFEPAGVSMMDAPMGPGLASVRTLNFRNPDGRGCGLSLPDTWKTEIPHCAPDQTRSVEFPRNILSRFFLRALQDWEKRETGPGIEALVLTVKIKCRTVEDDPYETQFRYKAHPFLGVSQNQLVVAGSFFELPMYPATE